MLLSYVAASRETAFVNAILAAGVTHAVTRACSRGDYLECGCDRTHRGPPGGRIGIVPNSTWRWGGCSEEVWYSMELTKDFLKPTAAKRARTKMDRHNTDAGRNVRSYDGRSELVGRYLAIFLF